MADFGTARVPLLGDDGRFGDEYTPQQVVDAVVATSADVTAAGQHATDAESAKTAAVAAAAAVAPGVPGGTAQLDGTAKLPESQVPARLTADALSSTFGTYANLAKNPDSIIAGNIVRNSADVITSADVVWPNGEPGTFTTDTIDPSGAVNAYHITLGSPVTQTFTQPLMTRNTNGAVTTLPEIVVS